jgi:FixJ family two-component response regulator
MAVNVVLTEKQVHVLNMLQRGCTNEEMSHEMGISYETIRNHMAVIRLKFGGCPKQPIRSLRRVVQRMTWEELEEARAEIKRLREHL